MSLQRTCSVHHVTPIHGGCASCYNIIKCCIDIISACQHRRRTTFDIILNIHAAASKMLMCTPALLFSNIHETFIKETELLLLLLVNAFVIESCVLQLDCTHLTSLS